MLKVHRIIALILVVSFGLVLAGCSNDELGFLSAYENYSNLTSYRATGEYGVTMSSVIPDEIQSYMDVDVNSILKMLSAFKINSETVVINSGNDLKVKSDYSIYSDDMSFKTEIYVGSENGNLVEAIKIPTIAKAFLPAGYENAEYLTIDLSEYSEFLKEYGIPSTYNMGSFDMKKFSDKLQVAFSRFPKEFAKTLKGTPNIITKKGNAYTLTLSDSTLKLLLQAIADTYLSDENARTITKLFVMDILDAYKGIFPDEQIEQFETEISKFFTLDENGLEASKLSVENFFNSLNNIPVLGDKGISVTYTLDKKGFISKIEGFADFIFDVKAISNAMGQKISDDDFCFTMLCNFKEEYKDINAVKNIEMPKLTKESSYSYFEMLKGLMGNSENYEYNESEYIPPYTLPAPDGSISIIRYGSKIDFGDKQPQIIDDTLYVPLEELIDGFDYQWDDEAKVAMFKRSYNNEWLMLEPNGDTIYCDDYRIKLSKSTVIIDDYIYVPLRQFATAVLGQKIKWNEDENAAYIGYYFD